MATVKTSSLLLIACMLLPAWWARPAAAEDRRALAFMKQRLQLREARTKLRQDYAEAKLEAYDGYLESMTRAVDLCIEHGRLERAGELLADMRATNPDWEQLPEVSARVEGAEPVETDDPEQAVEEIAEAVERAVDRRSRTLSRFTNKLNQYRLYGLAYDNVTEILRTDPHNRGVRRFLKHVYDEDEDVWLHRFYYKHYRDGLKWNEKWGWYAYEHPERYENGEYYDVAHGRWSSLEELNEAHRSIETPWFIETQHFHLYAGCDLLTAVEAANELEALYKAWIRSYVGFFGNEAAARLFDLKSFEPLTVYLWADRAMYLDWVREEFRNDGLLQNSAGFYTTRNHASQFYITDGWQSIMWHEVTHQIFGEASRSHAQRVSLVEGLAVYMQDGRIVDDRIIIDLHENGHIRHFSQQFAKGQVTPLMQTWDLSRQQFHGGNRHRNYAEAGLVVFFLMQYQDGLYQNDIIDLTRDAYESRETEFSLHQYCATPADELASAYASWVQSQFTE